MPHYNAPIQDTEFLLHHVLKLHQYSDIEGFADALELATPLLEEGGKFCEEVLFPLNQPADAEGCRYDNGNVYLPTGFKEAYKAYVAGGWPAFTCTPEYGGQGLPEVLNMPLTEMICSANLSFGLTPGLSHSAYNLMDRYCPDALKPRFLPKLISGEWAGVMCLTEPQAGTDLGLLRSKAYPQADGTYHITGNKIFISSGEQDATSNILHLVLARLPDAPDGVKGISLFLVPKFHVAPDGTMGERNAVYCRGIEHKMGLHGSPTCVMEYEQAVGYLIGSPHKGLPAMFTMMNAARIYVGVQGLGVAEVAYQKALAYCRERLQGRHSSGAAHPEKPADPLIVHPDIQRQLLHMQSVVEGGRLLILETALAYDLAKRHPDTHTRAEHDAYVQLMTPIVKAYLTDIGSEVSNMALQCFGGYGYIREYGMEQYVRDARICQIYEGTNAIQALDLVGRKLPQAYGALLRCLFHPLQAFVEEHAHNKALAEFIPTLAKHADVVRQMTLYLAKSSLSKPHDALAGASEYLRMMAHLVLAYGWVRQVHAAQQAEHAILADKQRCAQFFYQRILPQNYGLAACIKNGHIPLR